MKKLLMMILASFLVTSAVFANPTAQSEFATLNKVDTKFLFKEEAKVLQLGNREMRETDGKYGWRGALA